MGRYSSQMAHFPDAEATGGLGRRAGLATDAKVVGCAKYDQQQAPAENWTAVPGDPTTPGPSQFDAMLRASGFLNAKPIVATGVTGNDFYTVAPFQVLSWHPRTVLYPSFIDRERCEHVIRMAERKLAPSTVAMRKGDTRADPNSVRTSQGTFLDAADDPDGVLAWVEERIAQVTMFPVQNGEPFNVLRYVLNQRYESHYDVFDPEGYGPQSSMRVATMLVYLSDVEEGGETVLPLEGVDGLERLQGIDYKDCGIGLAYKPRMGDALLFYSVGTNGTFERRSLHGGCPVSRGQKWVMTKWIRDKCYGGRSSPCADEV
ncbi:unnamed protein product [Ostreobium quekettii]|uniref:Fe2OG dioxygenase domain-containing protein n=1 Tax=Ostreobium quekettii TaxID=121088 RepID=A0A8S1IPS5_9CHLO|nr:unnamed protein product [Ostreobium quekettii]